MAFRRLNHPARPRRTTPAALITSVVGVAAVAGGAGALASTLGPSGAGAEPGQRPVPSADAFAAFSGGVYTIDVLANDTTTILGTGPLTLCGVTVDEQAGRSVYAGIDATDADLVHLETNPTADGIVTFTYDACQGSQRATETVTVDIARPQPLRVTKKPRHAGRLVVTNPNVGTVDVLWGSSTSATSDGRRSVPGRGSITIGVSRSTIAWVGYLPDRGATIVIGDGTVTGIKQRK